MRSVVTLLAAGGTLPAQMGGGWMGWGGIVGLVVFALLLAIAVFAVVRLVLIPVVEATDGDATGRGESDPALATLREQFARGEIDEAEYERRKDVLTRERA